MVDFVLVHGMFMGGWCWDRLKARLEANGHTVSAPDLAGCGKDATSPGEVTLERWATDVAALASAAAGPVILVGHSRGGLVISAAAERAPERVATLVYLTALMLPDGATPLALPQIMAEEGFASDAPMLAPRFNADWTAMLPPENAGELGFGRCSPEDRAWAEPQVGHEPMAPLRTPLSLTPERWGRVPRVYVETTQDRTLAIGAQRAMVARTKADEVVTMEADHMVILTHVKALADVLDGIAKRYAPPATS